MLIERNREKLLNALIYFSEGVRFPGKTKLYKLLNYLDFLHYEKTGRSVTGLEYNAWPQGPVPVQLHNEWDSPDQDFIAHFTKKTEAYGMQRLLPRKAFDDSWFSPFELDLMQQLAKKHFNDKAEEISEQSHFETGPWHEVWTVRGARQEPIPYDLVLLRRNNDADKEVLEIAKEYKEIQNNQA